MGLGDWIPPVESGVLARNGFAALSELDGAGYRRMVRAMEGFQAEFLALTRSLWDADFPIPGDALAHFSRQWEYPYAWANLGSPGGRVLDAGSGITFFPFLLASAGFDVDCCDGDEELDLGARFARAVELTGCRMRFTNCSLTDMPFAEETFEAVICISVLEHAGAERGRILETLASALKPGGRLVLTCDVDLWGGDDGLLLQDLAAQLADMRERFRFVFPLDLHRPSDLLTSEAFLVSSTWRLPRLWRAPGSQHFRPLAVVGLTLERLGG
jgi:SAM-dependent methyltransferase